MNLELGTYKMETRNKTVEREKEASQKQNPNHINLSDPKRETLSKPTFYFPK